MLEHFGGDEERRLAGRRPIFPQARRGMTDIGLAVAVHRGGIEQVDPLGQVRPHQALHLFPARIAGHVESAVSPAGDLRHLPSSPAQWSQFHDFLFGFAFTASAGRLTTYSPKPTNAIPKVARRETLSPSRTTPASTPHTGVMKVSDWMPPAG